jgi:hypothetical protein
MVYLKKDLIDPLSNSQRFEEKTYTVDFLKITLQYIHKKGHAVA